MSASGPFFCGTGANFNDGGVSAWSNPTNIQGNNSGTYSDATIGNTAASSQKLRASNFGFALGSGVTIVGVQVEFDRLCLAANQTDDNNIQLLISGTESGNNNSTGALWSNVQGFVSFGGASDLWGLSLTPAIINNSGFGASLKAVRHGLPAGNSLARVARVRITVFYTPATIEGDGNSSGVASVSAFANSISVADGNSAGTSTTNGVGGATAGAVGSSGGSSQVIGIAPTIWQSLNESLGTIWTPLNEVLGTIWTLIP